MPFKSGVVRCVNAILDYLKSQRIVGDNKTIQVTQGTSGVMLSVHPTFSSAKGGSSFSEKHPFKLSMGSVEDVPVLMMSRGRVTTKGGTNERCVFVYEANESSMPVNLPVPTVAGTYNVIGYVVRDSGTPANDDGAFKHGVFFSSSNVNGDFTASYGLYTFVIGILSVVEVDEALTYSISKQYIKSDVVIDDSAYFDGFSPLLYLETYPADGDVVTDFKATKMKVTSGSFGTSEGFVTVPEATFTLSDAQTVVIAYAPGQQTATYELISTPTISFQSEDGATYYFPVVSIVQNAYTSWVIKRHIKDSFFSMESYKFLFNSDDTTPGFYQDKIKNNECESSDSADLDVIEIKKEEVTTEGKLNITGKLLWMWRKISGYSASKIQTLINNKDSLSWDDAGKVRINSADENLGFLASKLVSGNYTIARVVSDATMKIDARGVIAGDHITVTTEAAGENTNWKIAAKPGTITAGTNIEVTTSTDGWTHAISLKIVGSGIVVVNGDVVSVLPLPSAKSVLGFDGTALGWIPYSDCDTACETPGESSSSDVE